MLPNTGSGKKGEKDTNPAHPPGNRCGGILPHHLRGWTCTETPYPVGTRLNLIPAAVGPLRGLLLLTLLLTLSLSLEGLNHIFILLQYSATRRVKITVQVKK